MKKKILFALLSAIIIVSLCALPAFAKGNSLSISEDYSTAEYNGDEYVRLNYLHVDLDYYYDQIFEIELTATQQQEINEIYAFDHGHILEIEIAFIKGGHRTYYYLRSDMLEAYEDFLGGDVDKYIIEESYLGIFVSGTAEEFLSHPITLKGYEVNYYAYYADVYHENESFRKYGGQILTDGTSYYYLDHYQFGPESEASGFVPSQYDTVTIYKITDRAILSELITGDDQSDYNDNFLLSAITGFVLVLFLGITPLAALILSLVFSRRARKPYRTLWRVVAILLALELIAFTAAAIWLIAMI
jgi:hypothetical protein